jgi:hypothetical protein
MDRNTHKTMWKVVFRVRQEEITEIQRSNFVANKYIAAAKAKQPGATKAIPVDAEIGADRPALTEYLTSTEGATKGATRDRSVLMLCWEEGGVRVGLKDDDAGGWCWRQGATLQEALDSLEAALAGPELVFRPAGGRRAGKRG